MLEGLEGGTEEMEMGDEALQELLSVPTDRRQVTHATLDDISAL